MFSNYTDYLEIKPSPFKDFKNFNNAVVCQCKMPARPVEFNEVILLISSIITLSLLTFNLCKLFYLHI